jgi:hypothetical protein
MAPVKPPNNSRPKEPGPINPEIGPPKSAPANDFW